MKTILKPITLSLALAAGLFTGCKPRAAAPLTIPPPAVTVVTPEVREIVDYDEFTGRLEAVETVEVRPRVSGHLEEVRFQSGELVKKGDVLFVIDARTRQAEFNRTDAELQRAKVRLDNAEHEAQRAAGLLAGRAISTEEAEGRAMRVSEARAALAALEAARESARLELEFTQVRAPIDGRVSRPMITVGNNISGTPGMTTMLTSLVSVDPIYVYSDMDEATLLKFRRLQTQNKLTTDAQGHIEVEMALSDETGFPHKGHIESFDNRLDASSGSILLRTVFPNPDGRLIPGLFARVRVPGSARHPALLISERAIGTDQSQKFVLTLSPTNTVEYRAVKIGPVVDGRRVIREGLKAGDQIVVNGLQRVRPGMTVLAQKEAVTVADHFNAAGQ